MDEQRGRAPVALRIRRLGDTVTYTPHRAAHARHEDPYDEDWTLASRTRIWICGGILAALVLVIFGIWAVVTADRAYSPTTVVRGLPEDPPLGPAAGKFAFTVTGLRCGVRSIGPDGVQERAVGQFCLLGVRVTNTGIEPELFDSAAQRVYDTDGVAYAVAEQAAVFLNDRGTSLLDEIDPGASVAGVLPFDVPRKAQLTEVSMRDGSSGSTVRMPLPEAH
ncbi:DUF4352 domain-containing protein [Actinoplanes sp. NPDC051851]|uniref:DUF4352 domain-containing protein n=1 Tax=Actinoplanes sp. NPDC051851 TaxID=3154753 RepID=UPI0034436EA3